ncbi:glycosyl transferase [Microbacterium sediminicola]|uniref:Glycosyl transferase n=1 Tax=Microbacterium sediminicola TaxID=415210 RepID=A0ABN2IF70_9MICO
MLFAPAAFNLAETSRMIEIAKGVRADPVAREAFSVRFISEGGDFEELIESNGFEVERVAPRLTPEKIAHVLAVNDEEKFAPAYSKKEMIAKVAGDLAAVDRLKPDVVVTGSYLSMPLTCRLRGIPLVWAVQSTWLPDFFATGAGTTDTVKPRWFKRLVDAVLYPVFRSWMWFGFIHSVNQAAGHYGAKTFSPVLTFFQGDTTLVAEPPGFSDVALPDAHFPIGALLPEQQFTMPVEVEQIPNDFPLVYFAMGSSGVGHIVKELIESFRGKPYRVVAPVRSLLAGQDVAVPDNVTVTDWLPALEMNKRADIALIHGGIGTVLTAALAGKPVVGIGMQPEQVANISCLVEKGFARRVAKSRNSRKMVAAVHDALSTLLSDEDARRAAVEYAASIQDWADGSTRAARTLVDRYGSTRGDIPRSARNGR